MILYLDCASGVSGDMLAGALLSLLGRQAPGPAALDAVLRPALAAAGIDPSIVTAGETRRGGMAAFAFEVADQPGYATFAELIAAVRASALEPPIVDAVVAVARRMAAAEAEVHGADDEHLHELSDIDTAVDLIAAAVLLAELAPERVVASPPALGSGEIDTAHGRLGVPAPAVLALLAGLPTAGGEPAGEASSSTREVPAPTAEATSSAAEAPAPLGELTTPTGAALLAHYADSFGGLPAGRIAAIGYGAGRREVPGRPNVLRAVLVDAAADVFAPPCAAGVGAVPPHVVLEANLDDLTPELLAHAAEAAREAGALDVWTTPTIMKKGRPGVVLHVLAAAADRERLAGLLFAETSTFGLRVLACEREYASERRERVTIAGCAIGVRLSFVEGHLASASPEYEEVRRAAATLGCPARVVYEAAQAAARERFGAP